MKPPPMTGLAKCVLACFVLFVAIGVLTVVMFIVSFLVWDHYAGDLRPYLSKLESGMRWQQVEALIPSYFFKKEYSVSHGVLIGTYIASSNEMPYICLWLCERSLKYVDYETAALYFNTNGALIGIYYQAPPARVWHPEWGFEVTPKHDGIGCVPNELYVSWSCIAGLTNSDGSPAPASRGVATWPGGHVTIGSTEE